MKLSGFRILYLNVHTGCKESDRFKRLVKFIKKEAPDVLGLSELNGWERNNFSKLRKFKESTDMPYSIFCKSPHGYHLALLSKIPLKKVHVLEGNMWHGAIIAEIKVKGYNYTIAVTHLSPLNEDKRLEDVEPLLNALNTKYKTILMGDMNSISPLDVKDDDVLLRRIRRSGIKKFGTSKLRKELIQMILDEHFLDAIRLFSKAPRHSVPTRYCMQYKTDYSHIIPLRLDYIFVTKNLKAKVREARIVRNKETDNISDHYPVTLKLIV